jgi:hypothetical protein
MTTDEDKLFDQKIYSYFDYCSKIVQNSCIQDIRNLYTMDVELQHELLCKTYPKPIRIALFMAAKESRRKPYYIVDLHQNKPEDLIILTYDFKHALQLSQQTRKQPYELPIFSIGSDYEFIALYEAYPSGGG